MDSRLFDFKSLTAAAENQEYAVLKVKDTGIGMEPEVLDWIFEPFTQADRSLARSPGGLGLGLSLVKGIVELHGGTVSASSEGAGRGSEFTMRLPLDHNQSVKAEGPAAEITPPSRRRILIVDDNRVLARSMRMILEHMGHAVEVAYSGTEALQSASAFHPEVVLCDIGLPELDGYSVVELLREQVGPKGLHVIGVSGYPKDDTRAQSAGMKAYLTKPVDFEELGRILARLHVAPKS